MEDKAQVERNNHWQISRTVRTLLLPLPSISNIVQSSTQPARLVSVEHRNLVLVLFYGDVGYLCTLNELSHIVSLTLLLWTVRLSLILCDVLWPYLYWGSKWLGYIKRLLSVVTKITVHLLPERRKSCYHLAQKLKRGCLSVLSFT